MKVLKRIAGAVILLSFLTAITIEYGLYTVLIGYGAIALISVGCYLLASD